MATASISVDGAQSWQDVQNFARAATTGEKVSRARVTARADSARVSVRISESGTDDYTIGTIVVIGTQRSQAVDIGA
jgi:hypothetical protein